jgi:hypothetical protein
VLLTRHVFTNIQKVSASEYPQLEVLRTKIRERSGDMGVEMISWTQIQMPPPKECEDLLKALDWLSKTLDIDYSPPPPEQSVLSSRSKPLVYPLLLTLLSTVASYYRCKCTKHQAILPLFTHREPPSHNQPHCFALLLSQKKPRRKWQETRITIKEML